MKTFVAMAYSVSRFDGNTMRRHCRAWPVEKRRRFARLWTRQSIALLKTDARIKPAHDDG
jgi:hypothetical protein